MFRQRTKQKKGGYVYCIKASEFYKIGVTTNLHQRLERLVPQCPFMLTCVHFIHTDDMYAVENYWHRRFSDKRTTGEWFRLTKTDLAAFMKHKHATISRAGRYVAMDQTALTELRDCDLSTGKVQRKIMPTATPQVKRNPLPAGDHVLTLVSVTESEQPSFNNPQVMQTRWIWQFKAQMRDEETGERYEFRIYTGTSYGNAKATLTGMLDMMLPDWTDEDKAAIDTDDLLNTTYSATIKAERTGKTGPDGKPEFKSALAVIKPYKKPKKKVAEEVPAITAKTKAAPVEDDDEEDDDDGASEPDPFEDE